MDINYGIYDSLKKCSSSIPLKQSIIKEPEDLPILDPIIITTFDSAYQEISGTWADDNITGYDGSVVRYLNFQEGSQGDYAKWSYEIPKSSNYDILVWYPHKESWNGEVLYEIRTSLGKWNKRIDQSKHGGDWVKLATVSAKKGDLIETKLFLITNHTSTRANAIKIVETTEPITKPIRENIYINISGYDLNKSKRATIPNVDNGSIFHLKKSINDSVVYTGVVNEGIADFSSYNIEGDYYLECNKNKSYVFSIGKYWIQKVSVLPALRFMVETRQDKVLSEANTTGYAWRDSHQFSFELNTLVWQYMANPSVYDRMPYNILKVEDCMLPELRNQNEPDIIWLMKWGITSYYNYAVNQGVQLHALIKAQFAFFLYLYPDIKDYVDESFYIQMRDFIMSEWSNPNCNKQWYELSDALNDPDNNLFAVQKYIGDTKGSKPPGYAILPNLLMYEVALRDGIANAQDFFDAAYNNCLWLIESVDLSNPKYTKGQRMSEHITMVGLSYFQEKYPTISPPGLEEKINNWTDIIIARSNNMWDFRKYSDPSVDGSSNQWTSSNTMNEPGSIAGLPACALSASRVVNDEVKIKRLKEIATSHLDNMFGRNPLGRPFFYHEEHIEGLDVPWFAHFTTGVGDLKWVTGVLDGAPKESAYPYNPDASFGYSEGWVAFNTAWNQSLAYHAADDVELKVLNSNFSNEISQISSGQKIGIRLKAPLNFDYENTETAIVIIQDNHGNRVRFTVTENSKNDFYFSGLYTVPSGITFMDISYGYGIFKKNIRINVI